MSNIILIIQRTFTGLETIYTSNGFNADDPQFKNILSDERRDASQIAHKSDIYSINREKGFKVYSYINTSAVDVEKREGFYAIRLLINSSKEIPDVRDVLLKISKKYKIFAETNTLSNQNYDDILNEVNLKDEQKPISINYSMDGKYYVYLDDVENLNTIAQNVESFFVNKLYLFDINKAQDETVAKQFGMKPLSDVKNKLVEINVDDKYDLLSSIKVNNLQLKLPSEKYFKFIGLDSDTITYARKGKDKEIPLVGKNISFPKPIQQQRTNFGDTNRNDDNTKFKIGTLVAASIGAFILGSIGSWALTNHFAEKRIHAAEVAQAPPIEIQPYYFSVDPSMKDVILKGENISEISSYKFKYNPKDQKWSYLEGSGNYKDLDSTKLYEMALGKNLDPTNLQIALEKISGKKLKQSKNETLKEPQSPEEKPVAKIETGKEIQIDPSPVIVKPTPIAKPKLKNPIEIAKPDEVTAVKVKVKPKQEEKGKSSELILDPEQKSKK